MAGGALVLMSLGAAFLPSVPLPAPLSEQIELRLRWRLVGRTQGEGVRW